MHRIQAVPGDRGGGLKETTGAELIRRWHLNDHAKDIMRIAIGTGFILLIPVVLTLLAIWHLRPGAFVLAVVLLFGGAGLICFVVSTRQRQSLMKIEKLFATLLTLASIVLAILAEGDDCGYAILHRVREV